MGVGTVRHGGRNHQQAAGPRQCHIQAVQFLALARRQLDLHGLHGAGGRLGLTHQKQKPLRRRAGARPVHQHPHGFRAWRRRIGVQQQHQVSLQPLGAVYRQQAHGPAAGHLTFGRQGRGSDAARLEGAHQRMGREVAATVLGQRRTQHGPQVVEHPLALGGGGSSGKTCQHVPMVVDGAEGIMGRQVVHPLLVQGQNRP